MRKLVLTAAQFDTFVFPQVASSAAKSESEFETALRLLKKLKDPALTEAVPFTDEELKRAKETRQALFAFHRLREDSATFLLEEDEWLLLKARVSDHKTKVSIVALEDFSSALAAVAAAAPFTVSEPTNGESK